MTTKTIAELLASKREQLNANKAAGTKTLKPVQGKHTYRILPSWRKDDLVFWHDYGLHFVKGGPQNKVLAVYLCAAKTFGQACLVCDSIGDGIRTSTDDNLIKQLKEANATQRHLVNVLHLTGPADKINTPQVMELPTTAFDQIITIMEEPGYGDITQLKAGPAMGCDIIIERTGTGFDTKYTVVPAPPGASQDVPESILAQLADIDAVVNQLNLPAEHRALAALAKVRGVTFVAGPAATTELITDTTADRGDWGVPDEEVEEISEFAEVVEVEGSPSPLDSELDELDALIADNAAEA